MWLILFRAPGAHAEEDQERNSAQQNREQSLQQGVPGLEGQDYHRSQGKDTGTSILSTSQIIDTVTVSLVLSLYIHMLQLYAISAVLLRKR